MVLTLRAVLQELDRLSGASEERTIDDIGRDEIVASVARAALLGARGNSGVILSQLIRGAAEELASRPGELVRSEEHTSELQSRRDLVCRLLLEKKKKKNITPHEVDMPDDT